MKIDTSLAPDPFATLTRLTASALSGNGRERVQPEPAIPSTPRPRSLFDRLDAWLWRARQRDLERALQHAPDVAAAERLLAERIGPFGRYF
jgi:hypothetical protein